MRRASQRNSLVTLNEINITPLLDLAFVLLIIFVITRPALEQSIKLDLPNGGAAEGKLNASDIARVEITAQGQYFLNGEAMNLAQVEGKLIQMSAANPKLVVQLAGDRVSHLENSVSIIDVCTKHNIGLNIRTKEADR